MRLTALLNAYADFCYEIFAPADVECVGLCVIRKKTGWYTELKLRHAFEGTAYLPAYLPTYLTT
jgi:hypothetical protein